MKKAVRRTTHRSSLVCAAALLAGAPAIAADAPSSGLEEVVVTAQKRAERAQDVPISMGVMNGQDLVDKGIINIDDLAGRMPNVQTILPFGPQEPQFSIRGVTETDYSPNQSSPIALYVDGVFKSVGALQALNMYDTDNLQVLRGPQGTLQGRNATGGAILINTVKPSFDTNGYLTAGVGNFGRYESNGAFNTPLIDNLLAMRVAYTFTNVDGYSPNPLPGAKDKSMSGVLDGAARVSFLYQKDNVDAVLRLFKSRSNPVNYGEFSKDIGPGGIGVPPGALAYLNIPQSEYPGTGYTRAGLSYFQTASNYEHSRLIANQGISLEVNDQLTPEFKLTSVSGFDNGEWRTNEDDAGAPVNVNRAVYFSKVNSYQEELRLTSSFAGPENFILGGLYSYERLFMSNNTDYNDYLPGILNDANGNPVNVCITTGIVGCSTLVEFNQQRQDFALYFNNTYKITDSLNFSAGTRYTDDSIKLSNYQSSTNWILPDTGVFSPTLITLPATEGSLADHKWSGKAGLDYHFDADHMIYGSWSLGFRGSAFNASALYSSSFSGVKPETLMDYEVGSKNDFFDHRLRVNVDGFYYVYRNQQFATYDAAGLAAEYNLPKSDSMGGELEITAKPVNDVIVNLTSGYTFALYRGGIVSGLPVDGNRVQETPRWSFTGSVDWHLLDTDWTGLDLILNGYGATSQNFDANNDAVTGMGPYAVFDARLNAEIKSLHSTLSLWTQNLLDRHYFTVMYNLQPYTNYTFTERGNPRTFGATWSYRF